MKIPSLFKRKEEGTQEEIDRIIQENVTKEDLEMIGRGEGEKEEEVIEEETLEEEPSSAVIKKIKMDVDRLNAQIEALKQMSKVSEERFQRISEEIGELRRGGIEREKEINKIRVEAEKASQLVSQVQPEKLMMELEKEDAKLQAVVAKEKADRALMDHITKELKDIRASIEAFRGVESLMELNEEVKKELMNIKKVESMVKKHADKVEGIFIKTEKSFSKFLRLSQEFKSLEKRFDELMNESERYKKEFENLAKKEDLAKLQNGIENKLAFVDKAKKELEEKKKILDKSIPRIESSLAEVEKLEDKLRNRITEIDDELLKLTRIEQKKYVTEERFDRELGDFFKSVLEKIENLENKIEKKK
jgi:chromosome segregation ATPase